ncbi:MAG: bifunctional 2-polyprenyl-6-hydroxyphenol methylase/3-demethylubiquinol 3-O-methyltransferase UbiG [Alphaproteobacteria bacterium]|nr:bifunctional 2-polyprenyl-6-hydroxyphenol methylase/3-demethylubiquinol 3-O-methyltransferase UbiG [Alphaproteobacteria bacterium]
MADPNNGAARLADGDSPSGTVDPAEIARFSARASEWWDAKGKFAPLHKFNPVRLAYIREHALAHFGRDPKARRPFEGLSLLDIGCGGGLLSEPMARLGFSVTGADASEANIKTAAIHAEEQGLSIDYRATTAEALAEEGRTFDVILNMEVIEHVADTALFLGSCRAVLKPGGMMVLATLNRTLKAYALAIVGAEYVLGWLPRGTHEWNKFITPAELRTRGEAAGFSTVDLAGVTYSPIADRWRRSLDTDVNYMALMVPAA